MFGRWFALALVAVLWIVPVSAWAGEDLAFTVRKEQTPRRMMAGSSVVVEIELENSGELPWTPESEDHLSYHFNAPDGEQRIRDGARTKLPHAVAPGEKVRLRAVVQVPDEEGPWQLQWRMVREQVAWYPEPTAGEATRIAVQVEFGRLAWGLHSFELPETAQAGERITGTATLENTGTLTWSGEHSLATGANVDALAYHLWGAEGSMVERDGIRSPLPAAVARGERVEVAVDVLVPDRPGRYEVELEPVREGVAWFGPSAGESPPARAALVVSPAPLRWTLRDVELPSPLHAREHFELDLVVINTGTWELEERDRLSYQWLDEQGRVVADGPRTRIPALAPGEEASVVARVETPDHEGRYKLRWGLIRGEERWLGPRSDGVPAADVDVLGPGLAWNLVGAQSLPAVWVNDQVHVEITLQNVGTRTWSDASGDHLAYHWLDEAGEIAHFDGMRSRLPHDVEPGESVKIRARVRGPREPGVYGLQWEPVREQVRWYGTPTDSPPRVTKVRVWWFSGLLQVLGGLFTAIAGIAIRLVQRRRPLPGWVVEAMWPLWCFAACCLGVQTFAEVSAVGWWSGGQMAAFSGAALCAVPVAMLRGRVRSWLAVGLCVALAVLGLADLVYLHFFGSIVPFAAVTGAHHLGEVWDSVAALLRPSHAWILATPLAGVVMAATWPAPARTEGVKPWRDRARLVPMALCLALAAPFLVRFVGVMGGSLGQRVFSEQHNVGRFGYVNAHLFDLARSLRERGGRGVLTEAERQEVVDFHEARARDVAAMSEGAPDGSRGIAAGMNVLVIQAESLQGFVIGAKVEGQEITPFMNRLHQRGMAYPNYVDQTAQGKTSDAEYATLNSQHPLAEGALCFLRASNEFYTLAHVLAQADYRTFSAHPYKRGFWNRAVLHPKYGFESSWFRRELGDGTEVGWGLADGPFFERTLEHVKGFEEPWFSFWVSLSIHHPYNRFPSELVELDLGELDGTRLGNYLHGMNYLDRSLEALFDELEASGLADRTLVAIYGDHDARFELDRTPEIVELAGYAEWSPASFHLLERVPAFVVVPNAPENLRGEVPIVGGHVDMAPTLLHLLGIERPAHFLGRPLLPGTGPGFSPHADASGYDDELLYIRHGRDIPKGGACFEYPAGRSRPVSDCEHLRKRARTELRRSRTVVDADLHRELAGLR